jgi:hypothetical protein
MSIAQAAVTQNQWREIPALARISKASSDYVGMPMPDLGLILEGSTPGQEVNQWMKYLIASGADHPNSIVILASREFKTNEIPGLESHDVMTPAVYDRLVR